MPLEKNSNLYNKIGYSLNGLCSAFFSERAIRNEFISLIFMTLLSLIYNRDILKSLCVMLLCTIPLMIELINTSAEIIIDLMLGSVYREEIRVAKDMLSCAVFFSLCISYGMSLLVIFYF